jgi:hypothetical protein
MARVLSSSRLEPDAEALIAAVRRAGVLTMNVHPDRLLADGRSVAQALYEERVYRSQFETSISRRADSAQRSGLRTTETAGCR